MTEANVFIRHNAFIEAIDRCWRLRQAVLAETRFRFTHSLATLLSAGERLLAVALLQHGFGDRVG